MTMFVVRLCVLYTLVCVIMGNFEYRKGKCPNNKVNGETWSPDKKCGFCVCAESSYHCYLCPRRTVNEKFGCYIEEKDLTGTVYPVCCNPYAHVCPKDENFSQKKYDDYVANAKQIIPRFLK